MKQEPRHPIMYIIPVQMIKRFGIDFISFCEVFGNWLFDFCAWDGHRPYLIDTIYSYCICELWGPMFAFSPSCICIFPKLYFLAVHNSSIGDLVTNSLTDSLLLLPYKEQSWRLATIETFDQSDEETWPDWERPTKFRKSENFPKVLEFSEILRILPYKEQS